MPLNLTCGIDNFVPQAVPSGLTPELREFITSQDFKTIKTSFNLINKCVASEDINECIASMPTLSEALEQNDSELHQLPDFQPRERYEILTKSGESIILGQGTYGTVYLAQDRTTDDLVAIKAFHKRHYTNNYDADLREVSWTKQAREVLGNQATECTGLLLLNQFGHNYDRVMAVFSLCSVWKGLPVTMPLFQAIHQENLGKSVLSHDQWKSIFFQLIDGVKKLEDADIVHLDIKENNIMLQFEASGEVTPVIIDFGMAVNPKQCNLTGTFLTPVPETERHPHMAPELYTGPKPLPMADLYSVMVVIHNIAITLKMNCVADYALDYMSFSPLDRFTHEEVKYSLSELFTEPSPLTAVHDIESVTPL